MSKVLLAGESWVSDVVDHKGFDHFPHTQVHIGCKELLEALRNAGHEVTHMRSHDVAVDFPQVTFRFRGQCHLVAHTFSSPRISSNACFAGMV